MQPIADRAPRRVFFAVCGSVFAVFAVLFAGQVQSQTAIPSSEPLAGMRLELQRSGERQAALLRLLQQQQTPGSAEYHKWLTPEQFAERFAPEASVAREAESWLERQGFQPGTISRNGMRIAFRGTVAQVQQAFGLRLQVRDAAGLQTTKIAVSSTVSSPVRATLSFVRKAIPDPGSDTDAEDRLVSAVENNVAVVVLPPHESTPAATPEWQELLAEAAAQGVTVLQMGGAANDTADASVVMAAASAGEATGVPATALVTALRPAWQSARGLPLDGLRAAPDAAVPDADAFFSAVSTFVLQHGRVGSLAPWLYRFRDDSAIFTHADPTVPAGTWSATDGLGTLNAAQLMRAVAAAEAGTVVTLSVSGTTVTHGETLSLPVAVSTNGGQPSGAVSVTLTGRSGNTVTLGPTAIAANPAGGYGATLSTSTLPGDVYDISAVFTSGTSTVTSNTVTTTVNPENVTLSATAPLTAVGGTVPVKVTATSASGVGVPSGVVTVTAYGTSSTAPTYSATLLSSSTNSTSAVVMVPATSVGDFTFQANCTSNASFACNQPKSFAVSVTAGTPTVTLTSTPEAAVANSATQKYDLAVTVAAPAGSTGTTPTGTVAIQNNGTAVATIALTRGAGTYVVSLSGVGNSLVAVYNGDTNYAAASSAAVVVNAPLISTSTVLAASPMSISFGYSSSLTASVTPGSYAASGAPTGTITYRSSLQGVIGTATLGNGYVTFTAAALQVGAHVITASYSGDASYAASVSSAVTLTVAQGKVSSTTTLSVAPAQPLAGQNTTLTATVVPVFPAAAAGAVTPSITCTGQVTFFSNNVFVASGALSGGTVSLAARLVPGSDSLTAVYGGDTQCYGSTSAAMVVSPARVASAVTLQPSVMYANAGQTIQLRATVTGADAGTLGIPTGLVTFYDVRGGIQVTVGTAVLSAIGTSTALAAINIDGSLAGQHSFSAVYSGDGIFLPATSAIAVVFFGDFAISFNPSSLTLPRGGSGSAIASLAASNGFSASVVLTCTPPGGSLITCTFQPASPMPGGSAGLTVTTTAQSSKAVRASREPLLTGMGAVVAALLLPFRRIRRAVALLLLTCWVALAGGGCALSTVDSTNNLNSSSTAAGATSSSSTASGTPLGTQLLTITAASSDGTLRHTYTYPVTVQ